MTLSDKSVTYQQVLGIHYLEDDVKAFIKNITDNPRKITCCCSCGSSNLDDIWCYSCNDNVDTKVVLMVEVSKIEQEAGEELTSTNKGK